MGKIIWTHPPTQLDLLDDTIHIWKVNIRAFSSHLTLLYRLLNTEERQRADRYRFAEPRNRFIVARGILRQLLGRYTHFPPDHIVLDTNPWGKPLLSEPMDAHIEFNVAHSEDIALFAFSLHNAVGIDVERVHAIANIGLLVARSFSKCENLAFRQIPDAMQQQAFFNGWTRKEAYIKGRGKGFSIPLNAFDVTVAPGESPALLADRTDPCAAQVWELLDIDIKPEEGYTASLAVESGRKISTVLGYTLDLEMDLRLADFDITTN